MLKQFYLSYGLALLLVSGMTAQSLNNLNFENWEDRLYFEDPNGFGTTNLLSFVGVGQANVSKSTDSYQGSYSAHLQTISTEEGALPGVLSIGTIEEGFSDGIPYNSVPVSMSMRVKYTIPVGDTAQVALVLSLDDEVLATGDANIIGTSSGNYVELIVPMVFTDFLIPDELAFVITSGNFENPIAGGEIWIDSIVLNYNTSGEEFPNGDFENWTATGSEEPVSWFTSNPLTLFGSGESVTKSADSFSGEYAARIETKSFPFGEDEPENSAFLASSPIAENGPVPTILVSNPQSALSGYYKYNPVEAQDAGICYMLLIYDDQIGVGPDTLAELQFFFEEAENYTAFTFALPEDLVDEWPEDEVYLFLGFSSTRITDSDYSPQEGSVLLLDDLAMDLNLGIEDQAQTEMFVYPNPCTEQVRVDFGSEFPESYSVYSSDGRLLRSSQIPQNQGFLQLDVSEVPSGLFFIELRRKDSVELLKGIKH